MNNLYSEFNTPFSKIEESQKTSRTLLPEPMFSESPPHMAAENHMNSKRSIWRFDVLENGTVPIYEMDSDDEDKNTSMIENIEPIRARRRSAWYKFKRFLFKLSSFIGPGWLISMAYLDPGNLEGDIQIGGIRNSPTSGYSLLWLLLVLHIAGWVFQVLSLRLGNITGKDLATIIRLEYRRPVSILIWIFIEFAIIGADFQAVIGTAISLKLLFSFPLWLGIIVTLLDTFTFLIITVFGVRKLETLFCILVFIMAICFWYNFVAIKPIVSDVLYGLFVPDIPPGTASAALGLLGCVIMPHNLFLHSSLVRSRAIHRTEIKKVREANFFFSIETALALFLSFLINLAVVASFASPSIQFPDDNLSLYTAHIALKQVLGPLSVYIWAIGLFAAGQNSTMAGTYAGQYIMEGILNLNFSPFVRIMITRCITIIPLFSLIFLGEYTVDTISEGVNILQALILPIAIVPLLKLFTSSKAMGLFTLGRYPKYLMYLCTLTVVVANFWLMINTILEVNLGVVAWLLLACIGVIYIAALAYLSFTPVKGSYTLYSH